jgi:hypothetical protein
MGKILFYGKRVDNGGWVYGLYNKYDGDRYYISEFDKDVAVYERRDDEILRSHR